MAKQEFIVNMDAIIYRQKTISDVFKAKIRSKIMEFDVENIYHTMKNNIRNRIITDIISTISGDLTGIYDGYKHDNAENTYYDDFIPKIYSLITSFIIYKNLNKNMDTINGSFYPKSLSQTQLTTLSPAPSTTATVGKHLRQWILT